jgi:SAM-dependent methyltransferase
MTEDRQYYDEYWAKGFEGWSPQGITTDPFEEGLLSRFLRSGAKVMDFGCGDGSHASPFVTSLGCFYMGVDISVDAVAACRAKGLQALPYSSGKALPCESDSFDAIVSFEVFEHLFGAEAALHEVRRVLCPGGYLIGSVPNSVYIANRLLMAAGYFNPGGSPSTSLKSPWKDPHIRFFSKSTLLRFLQEAPFQNCDVMGRDFSLAEFPVVYRSAPQVKTLLNFLSYPLHFLGQSWPSLFSSRLYFVAQK